MGSSNSKFIARTSPTVEPLKTSAQLSKPRLKSLGPDHPLYPACDGERWSNHRRDDPEKSVKRQFLEAYFRINLAYARLVAFRTKHSQSAKPRERAILQEIEKALVHREGLEDRYAARGIAATPVYSSGFTVDLLFNTVHTGQRGRPLIASSASVRITIPLPVGLRSKLCKS